jgi:hypothetical protein
VTLCRPLSYGRRVAPSKEDGGTLEGGDVRLFHACPGLCRDVRPAGCVTSVTIGPLRPSPPSQHHPEHCSAIPNAVGGTGRKDTATPDVVRPTASRQLPPRVSVRMTTKWGISTPPPLKPLRDGHRARHDAPPEARFARTAVHSVALSAMPSHVVRIVRNACKLPPPWPIKGGAVPWPQRGMTDGTHPHAFRLHPDIGTCLNQKTSGTWKPGLLSCLTCSPPLQALWCNAI